MKLTLPVPSSPLAGNLLVTLGCALVAKLTLTHFSGHNLLTVIWPLSGLELALLLIRGYRYLPGIILGSWLGHLWAGTPLMAAGLITLGNALGSLAAWHWLRARQDFALGFDRLWHFRHLLVAAILGAMLTAVIGVSTQWITELLPPDRFAFNLLRWWQSVFLGYLLLTPMILIWRQPARMRWFDTGWRRLEFSVFLVSMLLVGQIVYVGWWNEIFGPIARAYWLLLFIAWSTLRFGRRGITLMLLISFIQGLAGAALETGVFAHDLAASGLENLWLTYAMATLIGIALSLVICERDENEQALRANEQLLHFALEGAGDAVWDWDIAARTVIHNSRWNALLGYAADEPVGRWQDHIHPDDMPIARANNQALLDGKSSASVEMRLRCKDGSWKWLLSRGMVVSRDARGRPLRAVGTLTDITAFKENQKWLEHVAHYDALTGTPNRVLLSRRLQRAMQAAAQNSSTLAVAYLDLDGFKAVNDRHGHDIGDILLVSVAQHIKTALRETDTLARIGGDEFVVLLEDLESISGCQPMIERLLTAAAMPVLINGLELQVSASIGVTFYPRDDSDGDQLLRHADQAMYQAKQAGRNRYEYFDVAAAEAVQHQLEFIDQVKLALERHEFVLYYQPKINMRTGELLGVEALARWQHPQRGLLTPAAFLPAIEDPGLVVPFGEWVIRSALQQMADWLTAGQTIKVSVNIAALHLQQVDFVARLAQLLADYPDLLPGSLEMEILETSAIEHLGWISEVMQRCQAMGVDFAIDDFGTGYSSLSYLRQLPAEVLKIDQSFVRGMLQDANDAAIVAGVIGLGKAFKRQLIPEGVETVEHGLALLAQGCEAAQGYVIARPLPAAELLRWRQDWQPDERWRQAQVGEGTE